MSEQKHTCPHGGLWTRADGGSFNTSGEPILTCGENGWLCPACREDRSDARTEKLVEGLALAGLLAAHGEPMRKEDFDGWVDWSQRLATALRAEREGGEG